MSKSFVNVKFIRFSGFYATLTQEHKVIQLPNKVNEIIFFRFTKAQREMEIIRGFYPDASKSEVYIFELDLDEMEKFPIHRTAKVVERSYRKSKFFFVPSSGSLYINADAIGLEGPIYTKKSYVAYRINKVESFGDVNYSINEFFQWPTGSLNREIYYDYHEYLDLKCEMEKRLKELRYENKTMPEEVDEAVKLLLTFKRQAQAVIDYWRKTEVDELLAHCEAYDKSNKNHFEEEV